MPFLRDLSVQLLGVEAGGRARDSGENAARVAYGTSRRAARQLLAAAAGRRRPDAGDALGVGRSRLSRRRSRARAAREHRTRAVRGRGRRWSRSMRWPSAAHRGHPARTRERARLAGARARARASGQAHPVGLSGRGDKDMPTLQRTLLKGKLLMSTPARDDQRRHSCRGRGGSSGGGRIPDRRDFPDRRASAQSRGDRRRGGCSRDRRAVQRSDGRWRDDPAGEPGGAAWRRHAALDARRAAADGRGRRRRWC